MSTEFEDDRNSEAALDLALAHAVQQLPREMQPAADLWPALQAELARTPQRKARFPVWPFAAAAVLAALWLAPWPLPAPVEPELQSAREPEADNPSVEIALVQTYEQQKAQQLSSLRTTAGPMGDWQAQLSAWDSAVSQVRYALTFYPDEPQLLTQLDMLYRQQLNYLQQVALAETSGSSTYY